MTRPDLEVGGVGGRRGARRRHALGVLVGALVALGLWVGAAQATRWLPPKHLTWYWQLQGTVMNSHPAAAYDIDGFDNAASEVSALHSARKHVICYIDVGTSEDWRPDATKFPSGVLGHNNGWPGERWLDVRRLRVLQPIMTARLRMCQKKGFDALEPDNMDGWENDTGFPITAAQQATYDEWLAREAHALRLAVFAKNDPEQAKTLEPYFDGTIDEQCNEFSECSLLRPYLSAGKPVLNAEYKSSLYPGFCSSDNKSGIMGALLAISLDGAKYKPCWHR